MKLGYVFDLNNILSEEDFHIPYLRDVFYSKVQIQELNVSKIIELRDNVMEGVTAEVEKHLFFFIINNDRDTLKALASCVQEIQAATQHFNGRRYEVHIVCNFVGEEANLYFNLEEYKNNMPCLTNNNICVYSWILEKYDFNADRLIIPKRRTHAIVRLVELVTNHHEVDGSLLQMTLNTSEAKPIFNLFGDSCVFFDEEKRNRAVRDYYSFKSIQHLLNIADVDLKKYKDDNALQYPKNEEEEKDFNRRVDATAEPFLKGICVPIEASIITEKTQGLLLKSTEDDKEYLVNASNNKLVFIDELSQSGGWQLEGMESLCSGFETKVDNDNEEQKIVSEDFLRQLYDKYITHERDGFDTINNQVSNSRRTHINRYEQIIDNHLHNFLNQQNNDTYVWLQNPLTKKETKKHHTNIDCSIAFLEYLESGKGDALEDQEVSQGDINFTIIKKDLEKEVSKLCKAYEEKKKKIEEKYLPQEEGKTSNVQVEFDNIDKKINQRRDEKRQAEFQLNHWVDDDADRKLTSRTKSVISFACGIFAALLWLLISIGFISNLMGDKHESYDQFQWFLFSAFIFTGIIVGAIILFKANYKIKEATKALETVRNEKKSIMQICKNDMNEITESHYYYLLAYHGLKTMKELIDYVVWKKEDLINFRKTLFKQMLTYSLSTEVNELTIFNDDNTFELTDANVCTILFGSEDKRRNIPFCFAEGFSLSETFNEFKRRKVRYDTMRYSFNYTSKDFNQAELEKEIIPCMREHEQIGIQYTALRETSILPTDKLGIEIEDIHQGQCGDCYFMATLAAIARINPEFFIGKDGMVEELGEDHKFFRVKFYNKDRTRVNVDIDNRFWNQNDTPYYAKKGIHPTDSPEGSYDPWVMAVEKAWAKVNGNGYDGIVGAREDGKEYERKVEYSFAVTGKSAFYCMTKNVPEREKLRQMMKKHFCDDKRPITLYSFSEDESEFADDNLVHNHAYALRSVNDDGTFDIFNPWNSHSSDEDVEGKHYKNVDIKFIKDNFAVVVFFDIKETDFDSFERDLTQNAAENEVTKFIKKLLHDRFDKLNLPMTKFAQLLTEDKMRLVLTNSNYLYSGNRIRNPRDVNGEERHLVFLEGGNSADCVDANSKMKQFLSTNLAGGLSLQPILVRDDNKQIITILRLSPHYILDNFNV